MKGLTIAAVTYDSIGERDHAGTKDRWEGDVRYDANNFLLQAEFIAAQDKGADGGKFTKGHGFYALAAYSFPDIDKTFHGVLQPAVRIGAFDSDTSKDDDAMADTRQMQYAVGLNYYLLKHEMKLQAQYERAQFKLDGKPANNEILIGAQVTY